MSRTALAPGSHSPIVALPYKMIEGKLVSVDKPQQAKLWRARCRYRSVDGTYRDLSRQATRKPDAVAAVQGAISELQGAQLGGTLTPGSPFVQAGAVWLDQLERDAKAEATKTQYKGKWTRYIDAGGSILRPLTLTQANDVQRLTLFLQDVADRGGDETARQTKNVLSLILGLAVKRGVLPLNAARSVGTVRARKVRETQRDTERAFTAEEEAAVLAAAEARAAFAGANLIPKSARMWEAVADLLHFLAGTGVRIGEARMLQWSDVDLEAGRVLIRGTKTASSQRRLDLPQWLADRLTKRAERHGTDGYVFRAEGERLEQSNLANAVASIMKGDPDADDVMHRGAGCTWATPHAFRRTVATKLDRAGVAVAQVADQLGHADPAMTMSKYLGRDRMGSKEAIAALL
jgi:integrase